VALIFNTIQQKRGTAAEWAAIDPVLSSGEHGYETDTGRMKIGNGLTHWNDLSYFPSTSSSEWIDPSVSGLSYIAATQFSVLGDATAGFPANIRVKATCTAGTIYGSVTDSSAGGIPQVTTITVAWDSGSLDSGLSEIYTGIFSPVNSSVPSSFGLVTGLVLPYAGTTAPTGWLLCYGQAISRTTYATLFAVCGTSFGAGDGVNTFNLPDLRGRSPIGPDNMGGGAANRVAAATALGATGGVESVDLSHTHMTGDHTLSTAEMPAHAHTSTLWPQQTHDEMYGGQRGTGQASAANSYSVATNNAGGGEAHNHGTTGSSGSATQAIMNPYQAINFIIRY
jgi:microcystin-dependent protein